MTCVWVQMVDIVGVQGGQVVGVGSGERFLLGEELKKKKGTVNRARRPKKRRKSFWGLGIDFGRDDVAGGMIVKVLRTCR